MRKKSKLCLLDKAYHFLSFRPRAEKEIRDFLKTKGATEKISEKIINKLKKLDYLNDLEFTSWWVKQRSTFRPKGKLALKVELKQKGIADRIIENALAQIDELKLAEKAVQKKLKIYSKLSPQNFRQKIVTFLGYRGFSWSTIKKLLDGF